MPSTIAVNATTSLASMDGLSSTASWFGLMTLVGIFVLLIGFVSVSMSSLPRFKRLMKILKFFGQTATYFGYGILFFILLAIPGTIIYFFEREAVKGNVVPFKYLFGIVAGYFAISGVGYLFKRFVIDKINKYNKAIAKETKNDITKK